MSIFTLKFAIFAIANAVSILVIVWLNVFLEVDHIFGYLLMSNNAIAFYSMDILTGSRQFKLFLVSGLKTINFAVLGHYLYVFLFAEVHEFVLIYELTASAISAILFSFVEKKAMNNAENVRSGRQNRARAN